MGLILISWVGPKVNGLDLGIELGHIEFKQMSFFFLFSFFFKLGRYDQIPNNNNVDNNGA